MSSYSASTPGAGEEASAVGELLSTVKSPVRLWIVRHAERMDEAREEAWKWREVCGERWFDPPLTDKGHEMARNCAEVLKEIATAQGVTFDAVYTSPMMRSLQTADPLARVLGVDVQVVSGLAACTAALSDGRQREKLLPASTVFSVPEGVKGSPSLNSAVTKLDNFTPPLQCGVASFSMDSQQDAFKAIETIVDPYLEREEHQSDRPTDVLIVAHRELIRDLYKLGAKGEPLPLYLRWMNYCTCSVFALPLGPKKKDTILGSETAPASVPGPPLLLTFGGLAQRDPCATPPPQRRQAPPDTQASQQPQILPQLRGS
uniref:Uncharacterized protein n=1 Tax=Chromera velia CCMP2878 TaxID=1169474 RepID=A0A0G4GIZ6_9ALVE|eukprot:Cvel_22079.t1-p1 / transcript=Cvel_22079.t1 / gene=Cvel_22079 / organism=Chromera_velia_CCMP2878 / gene_product=hypothetical protein / transcript_product=hypothetical protein / location=Cvel_scaffold2134:26023-26970(-) / protein_length=316 / sequence_SO=supercontig / SO=protein_coding / is_pseudo=false